MSLVRTCYVYAFLLAIIVNVSLTGASFGENSAVSDAQAIAFETKTLSKIVAHPQKASDDRVNAEISIEYPVFFSSNKEFAVDSINRKILDRIQNLTESEKGGNPEETAEIFARNFVTENREDEAIGGWFLNFKAEVIYLDDDIVSLNILNSIFQGGAHPESTITYLVLSAKTAEEIELKAFIPDAFTQTLHGIGEEYFRASRGLKPDEKLSDAGFNFEGDRFALNRNYLVSESGISFCFNHYEIGPYALGITEIEIPWNVLEGIADLNGLAGRFVQN